MNRIYMYVYSNDDAIIRLLIMCSRGLLWKSRSGSVKKSAQKQDG